MRLLDWMERTVLRIWNEIHVSGIWSHAPAASDSTDRQPYPDDLFYVALLGPHI